jgi:hypothetical protein
MTSQPHNNNGYANKIDLIPCPPFIRFVCHYFSVRFFLLYHELRAAIGAGSKRTRATNGAAPERPLADAFAAMFPKSIEGNMNLKNTKATAETKTLTHHGHSTSELSMDLSLRAIEEPVNSVVLTPNVGSRTTEGEEDTPLTLGILFSLDRCLLMGDPKAFLFTPVFGYKEMAEPFALLGSQRLFNDYSKDLTVIRNNGRETMDLL